MAVGRSEIVQFTTKDGQKVRFRRKLKKKGPTPPHLVKYLFKKRK